MNSMVRFLLAAADGRFLPWASTDNRKGVMILCGSQLPGAVGFRHGPDNNCAAEIDELGCCIR